MSYRFKEIPSAPANWHAPKTQCFCVLCGKDIKPKTETRFVAMELDVFHKLIHPEDVPAAWPEIRARRAAHHHDHAIVFERIGPECAKKVGREFTMDAATMARLDAL